MLLIIIDFFLQTVENPSDSYRVYPCYFVCYPCTFISTDITPLSTFTAKGLMDVKSRPMAFMRFEYCIVFDYFYNSGHWQLTLYFPHT